MPASALDLGELGHELAAVDLTGDGLTLRVKAQPARALTVGRDAVIGNERGQGREHVQILYAQHELGRGARQLKSISPGC